MNTFDDEQDLVSLRRLDPSAHDVPPAPGSLRYERILEAAMSTTTYKPVKADLAAVRARRTRKGWVGGAVGLVAAAGLGVVAIVGPGGQGGQGVPGSTPPVAAPSSAPVELSAHALVSKAVDATAQNLSMRARIRAFGTKTEEVTKAEFNGEDFSAVTRVRSQDPNDSALTYLVMIGDTSWQWNDNDKPTPYQEDADMVPFGIASKNVLDAALSGGSVNETGTKQTVRGVSTTRYHVTVSDASRQALSKLKPEQLAWFELEYPEDVRSIDVWVGDDGLVHRIDVKNRADLNSTSTEFYDFGANITITPPKNATTGR